MDIALLVTIRHFIALVFASAAWHKITHAGDFQRQLNAYGLIPRPLVKPAANLLVAAEALCALLLVTQHDNRGSLLAVFLLGIYTFAITVNVIRKRDIDCGCSQAPTSLLSSRLYLLSRNTLLLSIGILSLSTPVSRELSLLDQTTCLLAPIALLCIYFSAEQVAANIPEQAAK